MVRRSWIPSLCLLLPLTGCSSPPSSPPQAVPVSGKVLLGDGRPLSSGLITFHAKEPPGNDAMALIGKDGTFKLGTFAKTDGAMPGRYSVTIEPFPKTAGSSIPKRYQDGGSSPLTVEVKAEPQILPAMRLQ